MRFTDHPTTATDHKRAKRLRRESSPHEKKLLVALRQAGKGKDLNFRFQQPIHPYIVDFACMKAKLVIELDGISHDVRLEYDRKRNAYISAQGYTIIRFANDDVMKDARGIAETIVMRAEMLLCKNTDGAG